MARRDWCSKLLEFSSLYSSLCLSWRWSIVDYDVFENNECAHPALVIMSNTKFVIQNLKIWHGCHIQFESISFLKLNLIFEQDVQTRSAPFCEGKIDIPTYFFLNRVGLDPFCRQQNFHFDSDRSARTVSVCTGTQRSTQCAGIVHHSNNQTNKIWKTSAQAEHHKPSLLFTSLTI